eukprot:SAG11_NODE_9316_length_922_cov_1.346294_1_plen_188_part_10
MVSYLGSVESQSLAAALWQSLDAFTSGTTSSALPPSQPASSVASVPAVASAESRRVGRLARRFLASQGLLGDLDHDGALSSAAAASAYIPGYNPCRNAKTAAAARTRPTAAEGIAGCSDGLICISPLPNSYPPVAQHESGGCYGVSPTTSFVASIRVPPIPPTFRPEQATVYYCRLPTPPVPTTDDPV